MLNIIEVSVKINTLKYLQEKIEKALIISTKYIKN